MKKSLLLGIALAVCLGCATNSQEGRTSTSREYPATAPSAEKPKAEEKEPDLRTQAAERIAKLTQDCMEHGIDPECIPFCEFPTTELQAGQLDALFAIAEKQVWLKNNPEAPEEIKNAVKRGAVVEGMPTDAAKAAMGPPSRQMISSNGLTQWVYAKGWTWGRPKTNGPGVVYLYFKDDVLESWQILK